MFSRNAGSMTAAAGDAATGCSTGVVSGEATVIDGATGLAVAVPVGVCAQPAAAPPRKTAAAAAKRLFTIFLAICANSMIIPRIPSKRRKAVRSRVTGIFGLDGTTQYEMAALCGDFTIPVKLRNMGDRPDPNRE